MSWFDRAVARAGIDLKPREEEPAQANDNSLVQGLLGKLSELGKGWGSNVEDVYNNSPMYADFRGVGEAWDKTDFKDPAGYYDNNTYAGSFGNAAVGNAAGVVGGVADLLGMEKLGNKMNDIVQGTHDPNEVEAGFNLDYITSPHGLARSTGNVIGSMATIAPFTALVPEAAASTAATKLLQLAGRLGGNKGIQYLIDSGHPQLAKVFAERLGSYLPSGIAWGATSAPIESMAEGGGVVRQAKEAGLDNPYGRGWATAAENLPGLFLSNVGEGMVLRGAFKPAPGASALRRATSVPVTAGVESTQNAGEEAYQQIIQNLNTDRPLSEGVSNAALEGFFGSLLLGGAGGALHAVRNRPEETDTQEFKDWTAGAAANQDYSNIPMPTQGADIDEQVANLKDGWSKVIPQVGGILHDKFGLDGVISSGARSAEHNAEVGGAENSYHIQRADGGDALDIVLPDGTTQEQADAIEQYFKDSGMFEEVLFHDVGSGYHLHLGGLKGGKLPNSTGDMSNFNDKQREAWKEAQWVQSQTGIPAEFIYRQWAHESGNFTSRLAQENNNFGGLTQSEPNGEENKQPDGGNYYRQFGNMHEYAQSYVNDFINRYDGKEKIKTLEDFANFLHDNGYYTDSPENYIAGMRGVEAPSGGTIDMPNIQDTKTPQVPTVDTYDDVYEQFAKEQSQSSDEETKDFFSGMFTKNDKFIDTEENRRKIDERYGEELKEFADVYRNPSVQTQIDRLIDKAVEAKDYNRVGKLQAARRSGDIQLMRKYLDEARAQEVPQMQGQTVPQVIPQQTPAQNVPQAQPAFPIVQTPSQNAPQPAQQTEQAQPIQVPTQTIEIPQNEPVQDTTEADNSMLRNLQTEIEDIKQKYSNGEITPVQAYSALKSQEEIFSRYNDSLGSKAMGMIAQAKNDFRTGSVPSPQTGGNINGNESTENPQTPAPQSENTVNQNQNAEPGQAEAEEVNQPVQQEAPQANGFVNNTVTTKKGKQFPGVTWDGRVEKDEWARRREIAKQHNGWWDGKSKSFGFRTEQDRENFLQAVNAPIEGTSTTASQPVQQTEQEQPKKKSKALSQFKKNMAKVVKDYRKDKITYEEAYQTVVSAQDSAERVAPDSDTREAIQDVARNTIIELNAIYKEKNGHEFGETPSQTAQEATGGQGDTAQAEEPTQEEKPAQSEAESASNEGGEKSAQNEETSSEKMNRLIDLEQQRLEKTLTDEQKYEVRNGKRRKKSIRAMAISNLRKDKSFVELEESVKQEREKQEEAAMNERGKYLQALPVEALTDAKLYSSGGKRIPLTLFRGEGEEEALRKAGIVYEEDGHEWVEADPLFAEAERRYKEGQGQSAQNATVEENSTVDDDYHSFLDDKAPGAVAEIRRQLEKKDTSFGTGLLTTKHVVERWAETDKTNQSQQKGKTFYLHGNKVSKAVYDYYNHLILDSYINSLDENGNPKQTEQEKPAEQTEGKTDTKLKRIRSGKEEMQAVAKKYADGEISQTEAYRQVAAIAKEKATRAKDGLPNVTFIDNKIKQELNDYGDSLIDEAGDAAEAKEASESKFREISAILSKYEKGEKNLIPIEDFMKQVHNSKTLSQEHMKALDERAAKIAEKTAKTAEPKQEKSAEAENNTVKTDGEGLRKEAQRFKDLVDKAVKAYDKATSTDSLTRKKVAMEKISGYYDDLSPELKDHQQIRGIYENARIHFNYNEGEHMLSAKEAVLTDKFSKDVDKYVESGLSNEDAIMGAVNDILGKKSFMGNAMKAIKKNLENVLGDKVKSKALLKDPASYVKYLFVAQPVHTFFDGDEAIGKYSPAAVASILINRLKSGVTDIDELFSTKEESSNEQQAESGSPDGGHEGVHTRESGADQREETGGVSEHDGRKGKGHGSDNVEEHSEEPQSAGVRAGAELDSAASTGTDKRGNQPDVPLTEAQAHPSPTETPGHNYEIKENEGDPNKRNADVRYKQNIDAIKLLRRLEDEERMATPAEQKILAQFNGWGGLTSKFKEGSETDKELRSLLSAEEYKDAQRSSLSAYYTPPKIVKAIWAGLSHLGFKGGRILDPAMGVGNFFGCMPRDIMAKSVLDGVEMESLAARLARQLYPGADVQNTAFQRSNTPKNFYDLVITNIPFEQTIVNGYQVHNYYFAAGIDKVRPGGLMVYITGQGSLASGSDAARMRTYLNKEADLIGAFKLPSGVFDATQVGTDVVVFQKRTDGKKSPHGQDFTEVEQKGTYGNFYGVNQYFTQHRENVLGEMSVGKNRFGDTELNVKSSGTVEDVAGELEAAMEKLPKNVYEPVSRNNSKPFNPSETAKRAKADEKTRDREYYYKDGKIVQNQNGQETEIKGKQAEVVESYVKLKNSLNALLAAETDPKATDKQVESLRDMLNRDYNDFVKKHGYLHGANKRHFDDDPSSGMVQSLETPIETEEKTKSGATKKKVTGAKKASIFSERSTNPKKEVTHVDTASDALVASLNNTGGLDLEYMAKLTGKTQEKLLSELKGTVFKDPATENFVTKDEYLSGNVREKLILAKEMAKRDKSYAANVKALEEVQPEELVPEEIFVSLGTPWIPAQDVNNFVHTIANGKFTVHYNSALAKWTVTGWLNSTKFGTQHIAFDDFLTKVLNGQVIEIKYTDEDKKTHVDEAATKAVTAEAERLQAEFKEWIWKDKERAKRLTDYYNANFNNYVLREYDGSHLDPHEHGMNAKITLKPHQKDAVWRILQSGNTLLAHCVGAGKTFEMQTAGMEMRRLGMANKPMYLVPLNVVDQFAQDFRKLYPGAKLLVLTNDDLPKVKLTKKVTKTADGRIEIIDLTKDMSAKEKERIAKNKARRARTLARVRTEDWDGIIMSHTLFKELPVSPETQAAYMEEEFKRLEAALKEAKQTDSLDGRAKRTLEEQKAKLQEKMEEARSVDVKDLGITFEQLGIDQLFVDEADLFKNLHFTSSKTSGNNKIKGITNPEADYKHRAFDMFLKTQWLSKMLNGRGVVFATGTPISNSMAELYTMMRYLDPQGLKEHGTEWFDSWIGVFGDIGQDTQLNSTGTNWETVTKVRSYNNRPELLKMFRKFADIKQPSDLPDIQRPNLKGGKPTIIELPVDPAVSRYLKERVPKRIAAMSGGFKKQKGEDNMLALMNDLRNLSLSDSKIEACADTIVSEYKDSTPVKGTQLVFCDLGIPKAASEKEDANDDGPSKKVSEIANPDVYRKLIEKLVKKGIPREQIAFIQDYPKEKRQAVFEKVNNGEIRILIGSTTAMGAGTNCQKHLVALHDLDAPWRPRDLEQRHGRILRQGNENSEVSIYQYALKGSFDAVIWSKLKEKALLIELAMSSDMNSRSMEEADIITLEYSEMVGASLDDPLMKETEDTKNELSKVRHAQTEFSKRVQKADNTLATIDDKIETHQKAVEHIKKDIAGRKSTRGDNFSMTVGNKTFTKRDDAGNAMEARLKDFDESKPTVVGSLGGFALKAVKTITGIEMEVVGKHAYPVKTISVQGLENTVNVQVDDTLEKEEAYLEYLNQQKKDALDIQGQENPYAEKVKSLEEKLADLNRQIKERAVEESKKQNDTETEEAQEEKPSSNRKYSIDGKPIVSASKRSMDELKAEVKEAFPGAKIQGSGNKLIFTMPNGQKVTFTFHESITVSDDELSRAKREHGIDQRVTVTVEGYAESVDGEGFGALSQGSREGTGFHEAYHIAEAIAFTKKELADAKRLISGNEEERADAYAKWKLERKKGNNFAKLWQKIADVAAKLAGILGYETKRNIFHLVESGEIYQRDNTARNISRHYSVNASDNSTSSYKQRVKNFFMGKQDAPSHRRMLKNMMEEIADVKISYGKLDEGMEAIYKDAQKVIRVRNANDWEKVVPLFAKAVCDKIGIKADKALTHYISDWIQTGAPNNNSAEADTFAKAMREHPDVADQLLDLQSAFMKWNQMDAMERMQSIVSRREKEKTSISSMLDYAYDQIVEELGPVKRLVKQIEDKIGKQENALNPYVAFRLFRGHHGRAMTMLEGSGADMKAVLAKHYPNLNWDGFKTLHEILDSIGGLHDEKIRDEFGNYALACHVYDIHLQNDQTEMQIDMLKKQLASTTDADKKKELQEKIDRLDRSIMMTPISRTDCGKIIREYGKKYGQAQQDLVHFSNMTLAILKDSGVISETRYARILRKWPNYVPMFRVFDENENKNFGDSLKALEGSTRDVIDPLESIIRNTFDFVKKAEKNKAKCLLARLAQVSDVGKYIEPVDNNKPNDDTVITYYVDGQKRYLQTDPSVVAAVNGMGIDQSNLLMKILRFPARLARSAFTVTNPAFLIRNSTRDMQDAFIYNDRGTITPMDFVRAFMHAFRKDDIYWEWMASGAAQASAISIDRDYAQATLDKMTKSWKQIFKDNPVTFPFKAFLDATERLAEFSELGTRIAAYERTKKALAKDGAALTNMDLAEAAYESRDLMDFARGGKASRQWNSLAIFANASIQGWDKFFRTFNVRKDPKAAMRAMARLAIGGMLPALLLTLANWDEDWWKEIPDWQKDSHWILAPNVRIPKGQDIGLRFVSSMIEKGLDAMHNNNPLTAKRALKPIYDQTPDILPTAMLPVIEAMTNYSFFKEAPIVPQYQKDLPAKLQYSGTTSGLAKALGDLLNYSPRKIDHLIQGYTGSVGKGATSAMDMARGEKRMNTAVEEMPVFSGFMMTPYKNSATVEKFYQEFRKQTEGDKAFKATHERMEGYSPAKYKRMNQASKKMSELNKKERKLLDDNRISPERKQELQAGIQRQRIAIAKRAMGVK